MTKRASNNQDIANMQPYNKRQGESQVNGEGKDCLTKYIKDDRMINILKKKGIQKLFPIQYETFDIIYSGQDIVAKDRTGSGKTLAFTLPTIMRLKEKNLFGKVHKPRFLIILPTRQLAIQVFEEINSLRSGEDDFLAGVIHGGKNMDIQISMIQKGLDIIIATPGRLLDFIGRGIIDFSQLSVICLDQADEMLNMGFQPDIEQVFKHITTANKNKIQSLLFSATIPDWIWTMSEKYQTKGRPFINLIKNSSNQTSTTVQHFSLKTSKMEKQVYLGPVIEHFLKEKNEKRVIIFCQTKREAERIGNMNIIPLTTGTLHGDVKQFLRQKIFYKFKTGSVQCLVATNVAARGLDFPQIDLIIQMQPPRTTDAYIHRSGRTGRAGKKGVCVTFYTMMEDRSLKNIEKQSKINLYALNPKDLKPLEKYSRSEKPEQKYNSNTREDSYDQPQKNYGSRSDPYQSKKSYSNQEDMDY